MKKSVYFNLFFLLLLVASFFVASEYAKYLYYTALFALSGAITNEIAIFMLFNKVPYLYGSGVIEKNFEKFKASIKKMIMEQFFNKEKLEKFLELELESLDLKKVIQNMDFSPAFESLKSAIMESKFGSLINMFGGESSLDTLKDTFNTKLKSSLESLVSSEAFKKQLKTIAKEQNSTLLIEKIDSLIDERLQELTPKEVNRLVNNLIKEHLDWLVIWGAIFGAILGLVSTLIYSI